MKNLFFVFITLFFAACSINESETMLAEYDEEYAYREIDSCKCAEGEVPFLRIKNQQKFYLLPNGDTVGSFPDMLKAINIHNFQHIELEVYGLRPDGLTPTKRRPILYTENVFNSCIDLNEIGALYYGSDELPLNVYWIWKDSYGNEFTLIDSVSGHPYIYVPITD
ncbi:MAG: hypothetical protein H7Y00_12915 [Fimbriimonadaceae bacterium]|nr:hypothetical protein [Chitinophagales bacterium]